MPSQEMLKKLLEEFDEKEAQNREEINIVNLRVEELEKRISSSQLRLQRVSLDRQKVAEMMNRYANGSLKNGTFTPANFAAALPAPAPANVTGSPSIAAAKPAATLTNLSPAIPTASAAAAAAAAPAPAGEPVPASEWGIVKAAPPTPIIFDASLPGGAAAATPLPFGASPATAPPFGTPPGSASSAGPSISSPVTSASAQGAGAGSSSTLARLGSPPPGPGSSESQDEPFSEAAEGSAAGSPEGAPLAVPPTTSSPISSLSAASLFASAPSPSTATGETSPFNLDSSSGSGASPFTSGSPGAPMHTTPLSTPQGSMPQSLMQSMPIGGGSGAQQPASSPSGAGKFDMMDLFAPLSGEDGESTEVTSEPAPEVAEQALAQNQFYSSPASATAGQVAQASNDPSAASDSALSTATSDHPSLDLGEDPATEESEEGDDTVKSINDALRGLFR